MPAGSPQIIVDGSLNWDQGVDSLRVTSAATTANPDGLLRTQVAWLNNATVRDGGISQRFGWQFKGRISDGSGLYQGGFMYESTVGYPYPVLSLGGHIWRVDPDFASPPQDLSALYGFVNPVGLTHAYFCQAEQYLIIQAGDYGSGNTLPLFYNEIGAPVLRRSIGITNNAIATPAPGINEIPAATAMTYYMSRLWYAQGRTYSAGDIVGSHNSGTLANQWRDSVLNVTENPLCFGGDGFSIPTQAGNIRALFYNAQLDAQLGEGQLYIGTRKAVYTLEVPQSRADWINTTSSTQPKQTVALAGLGPVNDRSVVLVNGDVFFQTLSPGIASLFAARRDFGAWGNREISSNEQRVLAFNDRALLVESSGIYFDNRLIQTALPVQLPQGVVHGALIPLDFVPISNLQTEEAGTVNPVWEGIYEGLRVLQLFEGDFGGLHRAFAVVVSEKDGGIDLWELTTDHRSDFQAPTATSDGEARVEWVIEFPAFNWSKEFDLKKLVSSELWIDKIYGQVVFKMEYRPDGDPCWRLWHEWTLCQPRNSCETPANVCYPLEQYREGFKSTITLPQPPAGCESATGRPSNIAYQFQPRLTIKGWCRLRGLILHATPVERKLYDQMVCATP